MTKTLTEQLRDGELPPGKYYIKTKWWGCDGKWHYEKEEDIDYLDGDWRFYQDDSIVEVLAPVPSYEEVNKLQEQLKEANDLLKGLYDDSPCQFDHNGYCQEHGSTDGNYICVQGELKEYLERYGVK